MGEANSKTLVLAPHGAKVLPSVEVDSYNVEIQDEDGFIGDRANRSAFRALLDKWRDPLRKLGDDPFGDKPAEELDAILASGEPEARAIIHSAIEEFAGELRSVIVRFLKIASWRETQCIVVGGGFRQSRVGELAIARTGVLLKADGFETDMALIRNHPDEAGLIGAAHLMPAWMLEGFDGILAVDIGGTNIRAGIVETRLSKASDLSKAQVAKSELWRHGDEKSTRDEAVERLVEMIRDLIADASKAKIRLAPVIGVGCPGRILEDGTIETGAQNLPGKWEAKSFNLPGCLKEQIAEIGTHETAVVMHNDAVVQGLSELPQMAELNSWAVLTIGTGLGNAHYVNRRKAGEKETEKAKEKDKGKSKHKTERA